MYSRKIEFFYKTNTLHTYIPVHYTLYSIYYMEYMHMHKYTHSNKHTICDTKYLSKEDITHARNRVIRICIQKQTSQPT